MSSIGHMFKLLFVDMGRQSGLWLVNELYKEPLTQADLQVLGTLLT